MSLPRQSRLVLDHLRANTHLTSWQAEGVYRIRRLASRIDELRRAGYEIETESCEDATGQRYTRYSLSRRQRRAKRPLLEPRRAPTQFRLETVEAIYERYCRRELEMDASEAQDEVEQFIKYLKDNA